MNAPTQSPAATFQGNPSHSHTLSFLLVGLTAILVLAAIVIARTNGNQRAMSEDTAKAAAYNNALEMQYAQSWLDAQKKANIPYGNALEIQYAQPWLDAQDQAVVQYGNALEMQYARPWLDAQKSIDCQSRLDLFYACQNGLNPNGK